MIYKSYLVEQNLNIIKENIVLFYGENLGLKNLFKKKIKYNKEKIKTLIFFQEEIIKNPNIIFNEVFNSSLFEEKKLILISESLVSLFSWIEPSTQEKKYNDNNMAKYFFVI